MTRHSIEKVSFCLYLRAIADSWSTYFGACRGSAAVHIIRRQGFSFVYLRVLGGFRFFFTTKGTKVHEGNPREAAFAHRNCISRENVRPLPQLELPRVVGILHGQRVRSAPRARVQRDPQRVRAD